MVDFSKILLTVDYDRTLTGRDSAVPRRNLEAIEQFIKQGGTFTVNTGRSLNTFRKHMQTVPVNAPFLLFNGSAAYENGQYIYTHLIDLDVWQMIALLAEEFPEMNLEVQGLEDHYLIDEKPEYVAFYNAMGWHYTSAKPGDDLGPFIKLALFGAARGGRVSAMYGCSPRELEVFDRAEARILELWGDKVQTYRPAPRIIDIHARGVSKLRSARELQARLGKQFLVCVGDGENDVPMLEGADLSFCPADAIVADRFPNVCSCDEGAVADVICRLAQMPQYL